MLLILSSSKSQHTSGRSFPSASQPVFLADTLQLLNALREFSEQELATFMKISPRLAKETWQRYQNVHLPFTPANASQAIFTYQGDSYSAIASESYTEAELLHAQRHLRILSGLYGLLRPLDLIMPYRLEMATPLSNSRGANLYAFWMEKITAQLNRDMAESGEDLLINLSSQEYTRVIDRKLLGKRVVDVFFLENINGMTKNIPLYAKRARGLMSHYIISSGLKKGKEIKDFALDGYRYHEEMSSVQRWVFCREQRQ